MLLSFAVGCTSTKTATQLHPDGTRTISRYTSRGELIESQRFYVNSAGRKVLQGESIFLKPVMCHDGICKTYDNGVLVKTDWINIYH